MYRNSFKFKLDVSYFKRYKCYILSVNQCTVNSTQKERQTDERA